jgi:uncharacterized protein YidB (DUF937 family)
MRTGDAEFVRRALAVTTRLGGGGLVDLRAAFERSGAADIFDSWVSVMPNKPATAAMIRLALPEVIQTLSRASGRDPDQLAGLLAEVLPTVVDEMTPSGVLPPRKPGLRARWRALWRDS